MSHFRPYNPHTFDIREYVEDILEKKRETFSSTARPSEEERLALQLWEQMQDNPTVANLPFYESRLAPIPPLLVRMPDLFVPEEWDTGSPRAQLLFQLIACSFSSKWWLEFAPPPDADEDEEEEQEIDEETRQLIEKLDQLFDAILEVLPEEVREKWHEENDTPPAEQPDDADPKTVPPYGKCPPRLLISVSNEEGKSVRKAVDELFTFQLDSALQIYLEEQMSLYAVMQIAHQNLPSNPLEQELNRLRGTTGSRELDEIEQRWKQRLRRYRRFQRWYRQTCPHLLPESEEDTAD